MHVLLSWLLMASAFAGRTRGLDTIRVTDPEADQGVGIDRYRAILFSAQDYGASSNIPDLTTPDRDVAEIGKVLSEHYGFDTEVVRNASEGDIIARLDALKTETTEGDAVLVYFAGHGIYDEAEQRGYWLPADADIANTSRWVSNDDVSAKLRAIPARHVLMVVDSCFSGMFRDAPRPTEPVTDLGPLRDLATKRSRVVITSGANEPVSDAGRDGMSVFAYFLRQSLTEVSGRYVVLDTLFPELRTRVQQNSAQTPTQGVFQGAFHEGGQLVMVNQKAPAGTVTARAQTRAQAERACGLGKNADRDAYDAFDQAGPTEQLTRLDDVRSDRRMRQRLVSHACVDRALGLITDSEYERLAALVKGDETARASLGQEALAQQRAEAREVPPPDHCELTDADEAAALVRANRLLRDGTSSSKRPEDAQALALLEEAVSKSKSAPLWAALARARLYTGAPLSTITTAADNAALGCSGWGVPYSYRASALALADDLPGAKQALDRAVAQSPEYAFAHYNLGVVHLGSGRTAVAMRSLTKALEIDPLLGEAHFLRGRVLFAEGQTDEALVALQSAADLRPKNKDVWTVLAKALKATGQASAARLAQERADSL